MKSLKLLAVALMLPIILHGQQLVNPNATPETKKLKAFLDSIQGKRIISGQAYESVSEKWIEYIEQNTGKTPAILSVDLMDAMPWRVSQGQDPDTTTLLAINWVKNRKGIAEIHWHWDAPKGTNFETWQGFYTKNTTFDLAKAMTDTSLEEYKLLIRDIDIVSNLLKQAQDSGVPVLWRPLHEAEGGWFWWGAKGGVACKKLWYLVYDRMTRHHKLNNLIWVWNSYGGEEKGNWYPGDSVVDIIAWDYERSTSWSNYQKLFANNGKAFALGEEGKLPDPAVFNQKAWLYFITWAYMIKEPTQPSGKNTKNWLYKVYNDTVVLTLDDLTSGPKAFAGRSRNIIDMDGDGFENVQLDGSASYYKSATDSIVKYEWKIRDSIIANEVKPFVKLPLGENKISLTIYTADSLTKTASVVITIKRKSLSLNKTVKASSTEAGGNNPSLAVDGDDATRWSSLYAEPQWFKIDLGQPHNINEIIVKWEVASAKDYEIQLSNNDTSWFTFLKMNNLANGARVDEFKNLSDGARYVKLYATKRTTSWGFSIWEFEIYGEPNANAKPSGEMITKIFYQKATSLKVYPGILKQGQAITIENVKQEVYNYTLVNTAGQQLIKLKNNNSTLITIPSIELNKGIYFLKIENKNGIENYKFIVE